MVTSIVLAVSSPIVAVFIAWWGFRRGDRSDELKILFDMLDRYLTDRARAGRSLIHLKIATTHEGGFAGCSEDELSTIGYSLAVMNTIALCVVSGQVSEILLRETMGLSFTSAVLAAKPYIDEVAATRGFRPYPYAERLADRFRAALCGDMVARVDSPSADRSLDAGLL
jgi:hypothetical protein